MDAMMKDLKSRMEGAKAALEKEFQGLRTGRASAELLGPIMVDAYGGTMPLNQVGNVNVVDVRMLSVQVWDKTMVANVEKAIRDAGLGLSVSVDGDSVRVSVPELNEERRKELIKVARKYAETGRVSVRNVRRDGMDQIKKMEKDGDISEDDVRRLGDEVQKLTDDAVRGVDELLAKKEQDIMHV